VSPVDPPVAPAGEEIHLPGGSIQPLLLAFGITLALVGITLGRFMLFSGLILMVWVTIRWIVACRRDISALPEDHDEH
jgi:mannose/fructose/N-acetylgalactosamine-specific phosphotransferase system component IID